MGRALLHAFAAITVACWPGTVARLGEVSADEPMRFLSRKGDQIMDGDRPFRFVSWNVPNLLVIEDAYEFTRPNPWRWPDEFELEDALESIRQMGGQVARSYVISVARQGSDMGDCVHVRRPGEFNEEGFRALDKLLEIAHRKGVRLILPLVDQHKWWGGIGEYAAFRGKPADAFWSDRQIIEDFKATIRFVLERRNTYTGIAYRDEPAIFGWETGNELDSTPEWTREIAAYIKSLDSNHLVIDGRSLRGVPLTSLDDPNVDVVTTHHYPWGDDHDFTKPIRAAHALTKGKKPYFVGEFGFVETPHIAAAIQAVVDDGISGGLLWSLRMHRREGGFYWHMEVGTGRNIYKAFHWPGFESGNRYDERVVMSLVRQKAHEIRGLAPPPLAPPAAPKLLAIERVSAISWQGAAGALSYDLQRADDPAGEWQIVAARVSDADVQYRPLMNDATAVPGRSYYYRVIAHSEGGASPPSNVVGPVAVNCRTLVDECADLQSLHATAGSVTLATENARTVQEDCHRYALAPGAAITYRLNGPISNWRLYTFVRDEQASCKVAVSADGVEFREIEVARRAFPSGQTVYGYLTPVLWQGRAVDATARYLRVTLEPPAGSTGGPSTEPVPPIEIGRSEIEYDDVLGAAEPDAANRAAPERSSKPPAPASATVFVDGSPSQRATFAAIDKAAARGDRRLNVVPTILVDLTTDLKIKSFGRRIRGNRDFKPFDDAMRAEFQEQLRKVFARMVHHQMEIFILPHIDAGGEVATWRNWIDFDPLIEHEGYSYERLMIDSIIAALTESAKPETRVELALSGEMGTSLFRYPSAYRTITRRLRDHAELPQLKIGVSLNHSGIAGDGNPTGAADIELTDASRSELQRLIDECDFVGMSFYRPVSASPTVDDFVRGIDHFMGEFQKHGLNVSRTKPLHFSEVGIGGGHDDDNAVEEPALAVQSPWAGSGWPRANPWERPAMRELRRQYHRALLEFLAEQPAHWRVSAAFFWSTGSWDPQGMQEPAFADPEIIRAIEAHNRRIP